VFVTAYDEFAVQGFEHEAIDYVLKPVNAQRLAKTVQRVQRALAGGTVDDGRLAALLQRFAPSAAPQSARLRFVRASHGDVTHQIDVNDVLFFHADDKYTCVQTATAQLLIRTPIAELAQQLDPQLFWQVHRATLINLRHVAGTRRDELSRLFVRLHGHTGELPVSRAYVHLFRAM
jgi:DNA-binding LytR/AlgR family response regulator